MKLTETKHKLIELRAKGYSYDAIAEELDTSKPTLIDWSKELEEEIARAKAIELEALYEEFYLLKEARIKTFGGLLKRIYEELEGRDLKDVPTDKLLEMFSRYYGVVKEELTEPIFISSRDIQRSKSEREILEGY